MTTRLRRSIKVASVTVVCCVAAALIAVAHIVLQGPPRQSSSLHFERFVTLPSTSSVRIFDYINVHDNQLYVPDVISGSVYRITFRSLAGVDENIVEEVKGLPTPHGIAIIQATDQAFVTRSGVSAVDVFDTGSLKSLAHIPVAMGADAILWDPLESLIYVANKQAKQATLINPAMQIVATIALPGEPEYAAIDPQRRTLYQNINDTNEVVAIDLPGRAIIDHWSLFPCRGPTGLAIDERGRRLFAVCSRNSMLVIFDLDRHEVIGHLHLGLGPDTLAYDAAFHRLYATGASGELTVIQQDSPDHYHVLDRISLPWLAHTLAIDSATHELFVAYPSLWTRPRVAVFSPIQLTALPAVARSR
jgi:DNA-binding beta-propeller fold protein YncE